MRTYDGTTRAIDGIATARGRLSLVAGDLTPEPDVMPDYATMDRFFARQSRLATALQWGGTPLLESMRDPGQIVRAPRGAIPFGCWQQMAVGLIGFAISAWIWAIAPRAPANILFGIAGAAMLAFTGTAAVYTTREIAIDGRLFWWLSSLNTIGATTFGTAMTCLFLVYPHRLVGRMTLIGITVFFGAWTIAALIRVLPSPAIGGHLAVTLEMALIFIAVCMQVVATRGDPLGRAALRWFGTATVLGAGLFIATISAPIAIGMVSLVDQGWAFSFFLIIHLGVAIGLRRERLFAIENWGVGLLFYGLATIVFVALDLALAMILGSVSAAAALTGIILLPLLYLPARDWVTRYLLGRTDVSEALEYVARVALVPDPVQRALRWRRALEHIFAPLAIEEVDAQPVVEIIDAGQEMLVPTIDGPNVYRLSLAHRGSQLFKPADARLANRLVDLARQVDSDRRAYGRGVDAERIRVARDLHDDLAARLLSGLQFNDPVRLRETLRASLAEVRGIVNATLSGSAPLVDVLADSRAEAIERLETAGISLDWVPMPIEGVLEATAVKALTSALRELTTNVIRHADARVMTVSSRLDDGVLHLRIEDDGIGSRAARSDAGNGLNNIVQRLRAIGGRAEYAFTATGCRVTLAAPVRI